MNAEALFQAVESGDLARVKRFLKHNPNINVDAPNQYRSTPLLKAIRSKHKPIVEVLLAHGAAVNGLGDALVTPLHEACLASEARSDIVSILIDNGADIDAMTAQFRRTPLTEACSSNTKLDIARLLINAGADVNGGDGDVAPLHRAANYGNTEAIELLIQSGADVNILANEHPAWAAGSTPLHFAAENKQLNSLNILMAAGADSNIANSAGRTPLHCAAGHSSVPVVNALLDAGSDPLHQDNDRRTPLQYFDYYKHHRGFSAEEFKIFTALVAAGDRSWRCVPTPCPGLEAAMLSVWQAAPEELPELVKRLKNPPQNLTELVPRMDDDDEMKKVVQEVLRVLHFAGYPEVKDHLLNYIFGLGTV